MLARRIIPCLDVKDGRVVKGTNFEGLRDMADPVEMARFYNESGADELVFYDITASAEGRNLFTDILRRVAGEIFIPLTVGGGIRTLEDFDRVLKCGADKVSVNSGAIADPTIIGAAAKKYGDQCVVLSMDVKRVDGQFRLFAKGGREDTGIDAMEWAARGVADGAGEIVLNSIDTDGVTGERAHHRQRRRRENGGLCPALHPPRHRCGAGGVHLPHPAGGYQGAEALSAGARRGDADLTERPVPDGKRSPSRPRAAYPRKGDSTMDLKFDANGLIPAIVQDHYTKEVLTLAYMNAESLAITIDEGRTCFFSRSRQQLWRKGETSGNVQHVVSITADCDKDALVVEVVKDGPACHTGAESCFFRPVYLSEELKAFSYEGLYRLIQGRKTDPKEGSYTTYLFEKGLDKILKKVGEECTEVIIGGRKEDREETIYEIADLTYHVMVLMVQMGITLEDVTAELEKRHVIDHKVKQERMQ